MKDLSIKARLSIAFVVVVGLFSVTLVVVALFLAALAGDVKTISEQTLNYVLVVDDMNLARSDVQQFLTDVSATHDPDGYKDAESAYNRFKSGVDKFRAKFEKDGDTGKLQMLTTIDADFTKFYALGKTMAETYVGQGMEAGNALMKGAEGKPGFDQASEVIQTELEKFHAGQVAEANATTTNALDKSNAMMGVMGWSGLLATLTAIGFGSWIVRGILRQLGSEPGTAAGVARAVGTGDLSQEITLLPNDNGSLLWQLKAMQSNLSSVVTRVRRNAEGVATGAVQVAEGNHELADRTELQASNLVQTAASMKELADAVEQNADNARKANQLALNAANVAAEGGHVVSQVVDTMKGINESSRKISDIISVIDGIAFQTNILALNAAVEAARAGEQGRGFAVVASEVRSLAGRSAEAAKEIKSLINASVERVEMGTTLVDQAGSTMTQVVGSIQEVTEIVGKISTASHEQSMGVAQMGDAVISMENATQQNAALVEEMDAAAATLRAQAMDLLHAVQEFKLAPGGHGSVPSVAALRGTTPEKTAISARPIQTPTRPAPALPKQVSRSTVTTKPVAPKASEVDEWETF